MTLAEEFRRLTHINTQLLEQVSSPQFEPATNDRLMQLLRVKSDILGRITTVLSIDMAAHPDTISDLMQLHADILQQELQFNDTLNDLRERTLNQLKDIHQRKTTAKKYGSEPVSHPPTPNLDVNTDDAP